jgi:hypothetical protein
MVPLIELRDWLAGRGLEVVLIILGSVLLARFVAWVGSGSPSGSTASPPAATSSSAPRPPSTATR